MNDIEIIEYAIKFFVNNSKFNEDDILKIKRIHKGYTNISFMFTLKTCEKFQIRISQNNKIVKRNNEFNVLSLIKNNDYLYFDEFGNAIKKWIYGRNPKFIFHKKKLLKALIYEIEDFHQIDPSPNIIVHDYWEYYCNCIERQFPHYSLKYKELVQKYSKLPLVLSHNDINPLNVVYNKKNNKMTLIDFEWGRKNNQYWDYANFFKETNLNIKWIDYICFVSKKLEKKILIDFLFISTFFAYQWTFHINNSKKIENYRKKILKKLDYYFNLIS